MNQDEARVYGIRSNALTEKALISELEANLSDPQTPRMKRQLKQLLENAEDVEALLRFAKNAKQRRHTDAWLSLAESNIRAVADIRRRIQEVVNVYGGPQGVVEEDSGPQESVA
jgi:hypothetical protein